MCQYRGGLIGKHFKLLAQVMSFAVVALVPDEVQQGWLLIGKLVVLLWHTEILDLEIYIVSTHLHLEAVGNLLILSLNLPSLQTQLDQCVLELMSVISKIAPSIIPSKNKMHFLVHISFYIRRFGPAILFSSERFESYHKVFRHCSILSNRHAPSKDIADRFMHMERVRHIATGGAWLSEGSWKRSSPALYEHLLKHPEHARLLGLPVENKPAGMFFGWLITHCVHLVHSRSGLSFCTDPQSEQ